MKFQNAKRLCRICAFLLAVVMIGQVSITTAFGVSDSMGAVLTSLASTLNSDLVSPLADDSGIDIYTVNGKSITLKGNGIYVEEPLLLKFATLITLRFFSCSTIVSKAIFHVRLVE